MRVVFFLNVFYDDGTLFEFDAEKGTEREVLQNMLS